jgi:tetratricopeptide (TPR) repeat protein/predicted Ser/Thr protein kinase
MLAVDAQSGGFLSQPAGDLAAAAVAARQTPSLIGQRVSHYEVISLLGAGGMGEVYRARDSRLGREVAVKVSAERFEKRFEQEARLIASLNHPNICTLYDVGPNYLVMELVEGPTLADCIKRGALPFAEALEIAKQIADALQAAHERGIIHRDLKPANIKIKAGGAVKVLDFGLAKLMTDSETDVTQTIEGTILGTVAYMSPEQVKGEPLDQRSDLFSFGILLCDLLGSAHPFRRASTTETLAAILRDPPDLSGDLPQGLMLLIRRLLAKSRDDRYQSMADVRADLGRLTATALASQPQEELEGRIPLIGRDSERKELLRHLVEAMAGRGSMVMIGGEAGIGKTHLITAILEEARHRGAYANIGHCYEMEGSPPYVPFIEMLEHTARVAPKETFRLALGDAASEVAKLMPELRRMYPDIPPAIQLPPDQQRRFLFNAYRDFIERGAKVTPIIYVFEDLHWADEPTLLLLQHLGQALSTTPMLIIGTYRDVELEVTRPFAKTLETLLHQKLATRISLRRLTVGGVEGMLAAMSGQKPPASLARVVFEETEGNPFFVEEVFRHLSEEGKLFDEAGQWRPGLRVDQLQVPEGVRLVLGRRLDRVGGDARRVLTTAAVIGRTFNLHLLEELENQQPDQVLNAIEEAERAHLVFAEPEGRDTRYRFIHELVRQTLSETLSLPRRQRLHARVVEAIERVYAANLEAHASSLAHHLYHAGAVADPEKTTIFLLLAAKRARAGAAHEETLAHLENALSLWGGEQSVRVAELTEQRATALLSIGRRDEAVEGYRNAIALFEGAGAVAKAAGTSLTLAREQHWRIEFAAAHRTVDRAIERLGSADPPLHMSLLTMRALLMSISGDALGADGMLAEVKAQRKATDGQPLNAFDEISEMFCFFHSMQFEPMLTTTRRVAEAQHADGDLWAAADAEWLIGSSELCCGRTVAATARLPSAMLLEEKVGHHGAAYAAKFLWAALSMARGDLITAARDAEKGLKFGEAHQVPWIFISSILLGTLAFLRGNLAEAERWYSDRSEIEGHTSCLGWRDACLFAFWAESVTKGNPAEEDQERNAELSNARAWKSWTDRRWKLPRIGQANPVGAWYALDRSVIGLARLGKKEEAAALRPLTEELVHTGVWVSWDISLFRTAAGVAAACAGDWSAAEQHHLTAIHQADSAPYCTSQPTAREWYATMLLDRNAPGDAAKACVLLSEALAMYESIGMPFHASRTSGRLATL